MKRDPVLEASVEVSEPQYEAIGEIETPYADVDTSKDSDLSLTTNTAYQQIPSKQAKTKKGQYIPIALLPALCYCSWNYEFCRCGI